MNIQKRTFYDSQSINKKQYAQIQIQRHWIKRTKCRTKQFYDNVSNLLKPHLSFHSKMICLGTRNNHERDVFRKALSLDEISSCDIAPSSKANFVMDFNNLPAEWKNSWDIVYSNALDHAIDATTVFYHWLDIVVPNGYLILGFVPTGEDGKVSECDCNDFSTNSIEAFLDHNDQKVEVIEKDFTDYHHYFLRNK